MMFTFSKMLGYTIVTFSCIAKLFTMDKIQKRGNTEGIYSFVLKGEILCEITTIATSLRRAVPLSMYGESYLLLLQNLYILA